jgi:hypothetical protein
LAQYQGLFVSRKRVVLTGSVVAEGLQLGEPVFPQGECDFGTFVPEKELDCFDHHSMLV